MLPPGTGTGEDRMGPANRILPTYSALRTRAGSRLTMRRAGR
jgi:hypothetical protein